MGNTMSIWAVLGWVIAGGGIGGLLDLLNRLRFKKAQFTLDDEIVGGWAIFRLSAIDSLLGVGGALAVQFLFLSVRQFANPPTIDNPLFLLTLSIVAGFGGRRLLPRIMRRLERQIDETRRESREAVVEARDEMRLLWQIMEALRPVAPTSVREAAISRLTQDFQSEPANRELAVTLGRLYRANNNHKAAIEVIDTFLQAKTQSKQRDHDYADALYNRACYEVLLWDKTGEESHRNQAYRNLAASIEIKPAGKVDAMTDPDFEVIGNEERFKDLVK